MKKCILVIICCISLFNLTGCGNTENSKQDFNNGLNPKDLSIKDFSWEMKKTNVDGKECYAMTLTNNSEYDLIGIEIDYKIKEDVTDSELKIFDDFMEKHKDYIDENQTTKDITLIGNRKELVKKGETSNQIVVAIGIENKYWYDRPSEAQFKLMEPKTLELGIIGENNVLYIAYYDFITNTWSLDEVSKELNTWPNNELATKIEKPNSDYYMVSSGENSKDVDFTVYGCTKDYFNEYVETVKKAGFTVNAPSNYDTYYSCNDEEGNRISISYYAPTSTLTVTTTANYKN